MSQSALSSTNSTKLNEVLKLPQQTAENLTVSHAAVTLF
jgi:hypothetical protein